MAMDDLLKEAIADAKAVRETALANAKAALEEAFAPKLQSMLNATLQNETDLDEFNGGGTGEVDNEFDDEQKTELDNFNDEIPEDSAAQSAAMGDMSKEPVGEEAQMDEFSLESIVKELEEEAAASEVPFEKSEDHAHSEDSESAETEKKEHELDEIKNHGVPAAPATGGKGNYIKGTGGKQLKEEEVEEDVNLDELIQELKNEYSEATQSSSDANELAETKASLNEHREVIKFLRSKLNEVNLLNAKLLFTNKLFKNHNINESQKLRVIETLDRATTLKECKLVYSTLEEAYVGMKTANKRAPSHKIVESIASKPINSTKPSEETMKTVINEGADLAARFKKLAGITK